jgi:hypothetical protein
VCDLWWNLCVTTLNEFCWKLDLKQRITWSDLLCSIGASYRSLFASLFNGFSSSKVPTSSFSPEFRVSNLHYATFLNVFRLWETQFRYGVLVIKAIGFLCQRCPILAATYSRLSRNLNHRSLRLLFSIFLISFSVGNIVNYSRRSRVDIAVNKTFKTPSRYIHFQGPH